MESIIKIEDIFKTYNPGENEIHALNNLSFDVKRGEYIAIMGASGSGKSTLMNILGCLDTPTNGNYFLNGKNVSTMTDSELAQVRNKEIGFVFQTFNLLSRSTAIHNVELPLIYSGMKKKDRLDKANLILDRVGLNERKFHRPNELSGGQRQRVAIGRALINSPSIILADEPTGNLDSKTSLEIMDLFKHIHSEGNTIILVTHEPDIAEYAEKVIHLKDGQIEKHIINKKN